jgi:hypothetical protein
VPTLPYGPPNVRLIRPKRLTQGVRDAGVALVERKLSNSTVRDLVSISDADWLVACRRFNATQLLAKQRGRLQARVASIAKMFGVTDRTVRRWLAKVMYQRTHCSMGMAVGGGPRTQLWRSPHGRIGVGIGASESSFASTLRQAVIKSAVSRSSTLRSPSYSPRLRTE